MRDSDFSSGRRRGLVSRTRQLVRALPGWLGRRAEDRAGTPPTNPSAPSDASASGSHDDMTFLSETNRLFQACRTVEEVCSVARNRLKGLSPKLSGSLYLMPEGSDYLENVATWGRMDPRQDRFAPNDCWGFRSGRAHFVEAGGDAIACSHVRTQRGDRHLCLPLMAQGEPLGILYFRAAPPRRSRACNLHLFSPERLRFYHSISESLSLAIANLRLRESLRSQAIRDPLTGLFNRHYFEETLHRELSRAVREREPLSLVILDIDHFRRLIDSFGDGAGEAALKSTGEILGRRTRAGDVACRYGEEEFALVFPGMGSNVASARVENLRAQIESQNVYFQARALGEVTVSAGIAVYPEHATDMESLIRAAEAALHRSKQAGRNRVTMAHSLRRKTDASSRVTLLHGAGPDAAAAPDK